jgi:hypothetical protein
MVNLKLKSETKRIPLQFNASYRWKKEKLLKKHNEVTGKH